MTLLTLKQNKTFQIPATVVTVGLMLFIPYIVHSAGGPAAGGRWLPIFYAPFLAALLFSPPVSIVAGVLTPFLNHFLTGMPPLNTAVILSFELLVFSLAAQQLYGRWPRFWLAAPLSYVIAKIASLIVLAILPLNLIPIPAGQFFLNSLQNGWPGLLMLTVINATAVWVLARGR